MKKVLSILLAVIMLFTMLPLNAFAAEEVTVKLVSFMRGDVNDLRSSELLEVQVEGYDGNPRELIYKWTSSLGTYLYIYNSHNMYGINNTYGEYEIYNTDRNVKRNSNVEENRSGDKTLTKEGFMWASVYGAYTYNGGNSSALNGTVTVEVFDKNGKSLGSDSFSSFTKHNLDSDLDNVVIGLFEGDKKNVLDLLGESGVVHITCTESAVSSATVTSGSEHIKVDKEALSYNKNNYYITGVKAGDGTSVDGDAKLNISIKKNSCKFHYSSSGTAEPIVYVFKKPTTSTTTTTLTLDKDSLDDRCEYFIDGNKGEKQSDGTIIFTGLTPNTDYTVEVRAEYNDNGKTKYVYGYVDDTTKPVYQATVKTYLDGTITDISYIHGDDVTLLLSKDGESFIKLDKTATGTYEAGVEPGTYFPYHFENGTYHKARSYELVVEHANAELHLHHYSVKYDTNGGAFKAGEEVGSENYSSMSAVNATANIPVRDGFIFIGWDYSGRTIASGEQITSSISAPITLKAKWEKAVNVTINVTIDHNTGIENGYDPNPTRADLDVDFLEMTANSPAFVETGDKLHFRTDKVTDENGNAKTYTYSVKENVSIYTATGFTYSGLLESSTFGVALSKSGYDVGTIEKKQDRFGNWVINIPLTYNPDDFDLDFSLEMDEDVPTELYPDAVIVKIACWRADLNEWKIISQQETDGTVVKPGVRVDIDPVTGEGSGSYPVWRFDGNNEPYGYRAVVTGFIYDGSTIVVPTEKDHYKDDNTVIVTYTDGNYTATMDDIADGKKFSTSLNGAYYNDTTNAQQGTLHGVISVEKYNVTFDANGGEIKGGNTYKEAGVYYVPDTDLYVPTLGEHTFGGWYKDPEFKEPAVKNELLTGDITLYAKWDQILTGNVRVAGSYVQGDHIVDVWAIDRAVSAVVVLQEITADGVYNIDRQTVDIVWPMGEMVYGISEEYKFTGLDPEKTYRTEVLILNYGTTYQNSTTAVDGDDDYADDYNENDFKAVYPEESKWKTFVNAYLSFEPASYFQPVEVDATLIGEGLRPDNTLVEIWYKATSTDNAYQVISQHTVPPCGIEIGMGENGMDDGDYGYTVWNSVYDGNLYDYQAHLSKIDGDAAAEWPVTVVYGAPSRYSPLKDAPTGVLQVKLVPNRYSITYNEIYVAEGESVVSYGIHIWSYETTVDYKPAREGYNFLGWYANPECTGEPVTAIAASVAEDTELYAKWERLTTPIVPLDSVSYIVEHYKENADGTYALVEEDTEILVGKIGDEVTAEAKTYEGYCYNSAKSEASGVLKAISSANDIVTLKLYYTRESCEYTVQYLDEDGNKVAKNKDGLAKYGDTVTEYPIPVDDYTLLNPEEKEGKKIIITADGDKNVIIFYYSLDEKGVITNNGNDQHDGIPDKYQKKIIFKVIGGTWADGKTKDIVYYVTLKTDGENDVNGTAELTVPEGMLPLDGFEGGSWGENIPPATVSGTNTEVYTYTFAEVVKPPVDPEPENPDDSGNTDTPENPDGEGEGEGNGSLNGGAHHIVFGKTDGIGWYNVSKDGGQTWEIVFGNSTYEVEYGTELIIKAGDIMGDSFTFYVNGDAVKPDDNDEIRVTVTGYMLIGAIGIDPDLDFEVPDAEESLNWFQKIIKAIKDFFDKIFGWMK